MQLSELTEPELIFPGLEAADGASVLREVSQRLAASGRIRRPQRLLERLIEREGLGSTAMGHGVAVPHCRFQGSSELLVAVGLCPQGVDFHAEDGEPVKVFFVVVSPNSAAVEHLKCLAAISKWIKNDRMSSLLEIDDPEEIYRLIGETARVDG
jgi:mannitol/fructose-specific phosphotransferase system IIA component (Ntr-type)